VENNGIKLRERQSNSHGAINFGFFFETKNWCGKVVKKVMAKVVRKTDELFKFIWSK
jgi:hypothetical protein